MRRVWEEGGVWRVVRWGFVLGWRGMRGVGEEVVVEGEDILGRRGFIISNRGVNSIRDRVRWLLRLGGEVEVGG